MVVHVVNHADYMMLALTEARQAYDQKEVPIGAVVVVGDTVIARAHNMREAWNDPTAHAEIIAIRQACTNLGRWRLSGAVMYVTIEPCPMCAGALVQSRIDKLVYGAADLKAGAVHSLFQITQTPALNHRIEVVNGVLEEECAALMRQFFQERRLRRGG